MKKYDKKLITLGIMIVVIVSIIIIGLTYAFFSANVIGNDKAEPTVVDTAYLRLVFNDTQFLRLENALPGASASKTFTVTNNSSIKIKYDINIIDVYNTFQNDELVYSLTSTNNGASVIEEVLPITDEVLVGKIEVEPGVTQVYTITIKFKETGEDQNYNQGAEFRGKLQINTSTAYSEDVIFEIESSAGEVYKGSSKEVNILGSYYGEVSCESENINIAECSAEQSKITVEGKSRGITNLLVREDIKNLEIMYSVRVLEPSLGLTETVGEVILGATKNINITGEDYGELTCESSNTSIATCGINDTKLTITGMSLGNTIITLRESISNKTVDYNVTVISSEYLYEFTGSPQEFGVPVTGTYKIELWGSGTRSTKYSYGSGGYAKGEIQLEANEKIYIYVGAVSNIFNGGGNVVGTSPGGPDYGNGATDVRLVGGSWDNDISLNSRIMVAGAGAKSSDLKSGDPWAGAGCTWISSGKHAAGGLIGDSSIYTNNCSATSYRNTAAEGGTQTAGGVRATTNFGSTSLGTNGSFGIGGSGGPCKDSYYTCATNGGSGPVKSGLGGAGGYYGGGGCWGPYPGQTDCVGSGSGSSFISGHIGSIAITSESDRTPKSSGTDLEKATHYSGKIFTNTEMIDGVGYEWTNARYQLKQMPNPLGGLYELGKGYSGNGYAKITFID